MIPEYSLNYREALQTPAEGISDKLQRQTPDLLPPPILNCTFLKKVIEKMPQHKELFLELPNPISSPTVLHQLKEILACAKQNQVDEQIAVHTRLAPEDIDLAIKTGAKRLYVYASTQPRNFRPGFKVEDILDKIETAAKTVQNTQVEYIRASLEHTTLTPETQVAAFLDGLKQINLRLPNPVIKGLGIPDTTGIADSERYKSYLELIASHMPDPPLTIFVHLHDDNEKAEDNLETILKESSKHSLPVCIEIVPSAYPGERVGIKPYIENVLPKNTTIDISEILYVIEGQSWITRNLTRQFVPSIHVAGVHTNSMQTYGNHNVINFPHPGLYTIMGGNNFRFVQRTLWNGESSGETIKNIALLGREISAQYGNLPHAWTITLAQIALMSPHDIQAIVSHFGPPSTWHSKPAPNLHEFYNKIKPNEFP